MTCANDSSNLVSKQEQAIHYSSWLLEGVRWRRVVAIGLDLALIMIISAFLYVFLGLLTFSLAWWFLPPLMPFVAFFYNGWTVSGARQATPGMRFMNLIMRTETGEPVSFIRASVHAALYYATIALLSPFLLLVSFLTTDKRCLHDMLSGVTIFRRAW